MSKYEINVEHPKKISEGNNASLYIYIPRLPKIPIGMAVMSATCCGEKFLTGIILILFE